MDAPKSIASLIEALAGVAPPDATGELQTLQGWQRELPANADTAYVACALHAWLLTNESEGLLAVTESPYLRSLIESVAALSRRAMQGSPASPEEWKVVRKAAVAATDAMPAGDDRVFICKATENAAWNPVTSSTVLASIFRSMSQYMAHRAVRSAGWTAADDAQAGAQFAALREQLKELTARGETPDPMALLAQRDPRFAERFASVQELQQIAQRLYREKCSKALQDLSRAAPIRAN